MTSRVETRVSALLRELIGERADALLQLIPEQAAATIAEALPDFPPQVAHDIAFHMTDWNRDAAFLVAVLLRPDAFTPTEIRDGLREFLVHAPNHIAAAAKLGGYPIADIFHIGALDGPPVEPTSDRAV